MVLIAEIAAIAILHAVKINQEKKNDLKVTSHISSSVGDDVKIKSLSMLTKY